MFSTPNVKEKVNNCDIFIRFIAQTASTKMFLDVTMSLRKVENFGGEGKLNLNIQKLLCLSRQQKKTFCLDGHF